MSKNKEPGNLVYLDMITRHDIPAERVLDRAQEANLESAIVIGQLPDEEFYFASNKADAAEVIYLLEVAKKRLLEIADG